MSIDWFTLIAQIINLVILLLLLRKFLYLPVLKAVEARQKFIADELKSAEQSRVKAQKAEKLCLKKAQEIENEKQHILAQVQLEAEKMAEDLRKQVQFQYQQSQKEWAKRLHGEQKNFDIALQKLVAGHFNRFAEKALQQMADMELNEWVVRRFVQKIKDLSADEKAEMRKNFKSQSILRLQSAQELSAELKREIEYLLNAECGISREAEFLYEVNSDLVCGIVLQGGEYQIEWSLNGYLEEFKQIMAKEVSCLINRGAQ